MSHFADLTASEPEGHYSSEQRLGFFVPDGLEGNYQGNAIGLHHGIQCSNFYHCKNHKKGIGDNRTYRRLECFHSRQTGRMVGVAVERLAFCDISGDLDFFQPLTLTEFLQLHLAV